MHGFRQTIKITIIGGLVFLVPVGIALAIAGKLLALIGLMVAPISRLIPTDYIGGVTVATILTVLIILLFCYLAGVIARSSLGTMISNAIESKLELLLPRYAFVKSITASLAGAKGEMSSLTPVQVTFDDYMQLAFEVHRDPDDWVTIYLPGAPDPWSGSIVHVTPDRVKPLDVNFVAVIKILTRVGVGSETIIKSLKK